MGYQVLARKWRPGKFSELVGQEHVVRAISNALDNNRLHHAYLFTGTRGVGKTTIARIFSRSLNCEKGMSSNPCGVCPACLDIEKGSYVDLIEIDAASRTKVEDTREILDNVQYRPTRGEYKVYLIDEVHMLSKHSFNALLKTLEEPPPHIKFLLATTDPQKLPITILSRCLQFNLKALTREQIGGQLSHILKAENIAFQENAIQLLARSAHGSMRDALSLTDQAIAQGNGQVMSDVVSEMLGLIDADQITNLVKAILEKDKIRVLEISSELALMGTDFKAALAELMSIFHQIALTQFVPEACKLETSQARQIYAWARAVNPESVQLYYQIALQGRKDIEWAQDLKVGFEMALMRIMAFTPEAIKTDISVLQAGSKQANEAHSQQSSPPPERLLTDSDSQTEQAAPPEKKNESEPESVTTAVSNFEPESEQQTLVESSVSAEPGIEKASTTAHPTTEKESEDASSGSLAPESVQKHETEQSSELSEAHTLDPDNESLSNEMLSLMQEANDLRPEQSTFQASPQYSSAQGDVAHELQPPPDKPQTVIEEPQLKEEGARLIPEQSQPITDEMHGQGDKFQPDYAQYQGTQPYTDYEMMPQSNEMPLPMEDFHAHVTDNYSDSVVPSQESELKETGSGANTASLLSLMQTLNQATAEDNKPANGKGSDANDGKAKEKPELPEKDLSQTNLRETLAEEPLGKETGQANPASESLETIESTPTSPAPLQSSTYNYSDDLYQTGNSQAETIVQTVESQSDQQPDTEDEAFFSAQNFLNQQETTSPPEHEIVPAHLQDISQQSQPAQNLNAPENDNWHSDTQANTLMQAQTFQPETLDTTGFQSETAEQSYPKVTGVDSEEHQLSGQETSFSPQNSDFFYGHDAPPDRDESQTAVLQDDLNSYSQMPASQEYEPNTNELEANAHPRTVQGQQTSEEEYLATDTTMSVDFEIPFAVDGKKVTRASQLDTWSQLIERAGLGGLTKQLALNSNYFKNGENIKLVVSETQTHLLSENTIKTIEESISGAIQQPIKVDANIGEVIDTPAAVQKAINTMRQQHAVKTINEDSAITDICQSFSGTVLQDTIKPR